ncbi:MAG: hypothetical protein CSA94_00895 [Bacteroidetes bacterium]|nr:MAG: hypothetical protein CSA94_00895 [Bacteroidota bacterium]
MSEKQKKAITLTVIGIFLMLTSYLTIKDMYWLAGAFPIAIALVWMYIFRLDWVMFLIAFSTPIAIGLENFNLGFNVSIPSEPLMLGVLGVFFVKTLFEGGYNKKALKHPVTLLIIAHLVWLFFTSITSELPLVSIKHSLSRLWFVTTSFFVAVLLFKELKNIRTFFWFYIASLIIVIVYTTNIHAQYGFSEKVGHWAMSPFYNDHTAYGAILALLLPFSLSGVFAKKTYSKSYRIISLIASIILLGALFLSYSRAAWLSIIGAIGVWVVILLKIKFKYIFGILGILLIIGFSFQHQIIDYLEDNNQESSGDFLEHVQSMSNISTDASNMERINRWQSAIRMFEARPVVGWGPGTYQFVYAPFQHSKEKTIISTNFGDVGSSHSEYLGALSESGLAGMVLFLMIAFFTLHRALVIYQQSKNQEVRMIALYTLLGLTTYFLHGFLNAFLDTDKLSVPFWAMVATIVALDIFHYKTDTQEEKKLL